MRSSHFDERGQMVPLVAVFLVLLTTCSFAVVRISQVFAADARADAVADLVALAGAAGGLEQAQGLAADNQAVVVRSEISGREFAVWVQVEGRQASARARLTRR